MTKQQRLKEFYENKFLAGSIPNHYSSPHLISLNDSIDTDIMIVGQETNTWYGSYKYFQDRGIDVQMEIYSKFMKEHYQTMNTLFWKYTKNIIDDTSKIPVWTNIFKFDLGDKSGKSKNISKASKEEYTKIIEFHHDILAQEIAIIQPKIIVFWTGPDYDKLFFDPIVKKEGDYKNLYKKIPDLDNIDEWKCSKLELSNFKGFENFKGKAYRTYHPGFLNRKYNDFGRKIIEYLKKEIKRELKS